MGTRTRFGLAIALLLALATKGHAQETGGSFDSEDWGSEPSSESGSSDWGSSSGSSDWGSSSGSSDWGSSGGSSDWGSSSGAAPSYPSTDDGTAYPRTDYDTSPHASYSPASTVGGDWALPFVIAIFVFGLFVLIVFVVIQRSVANDASAQLRAYGSDRLPVVGPRPVAGLVDVSMLQLAIDWRARRFVQAELAELARGGDTQSKEGRLALLRATTKALRSVRLAWLYAGARNFRPMQQSQAQREFQQIANDVRASFRQEIVRASAGRVVSVEAVGVRARESEGPGVVLVSVIVAARREIFDVDAQRASSIDRLIASLEALSATDVIALSVVWTPAAEEDRMSTDELEARHRHLVRIGDIGGRVFCGYCSGPHAQELASCPHCGAPTGAPPASAG